MKFIKMDVVRMDILPTWWVKFNTTELKLLLIVNESKAPKRHFHLKLGGNS